MENETTPPLLSHPDSKADAANMNDDNTPPSGSQQAFELDTKPSLKPREKPRLSIMQRKFLAAEGKGPEPRPPGYLPYSERFPKPYFFYGSLMDGKRLSQVLDLVEEPETRPAHIMGFRCMLWGPYPALIWSQGDIVHGVVYEVKSKEEARKLQHYETNLYRMRPCFLEYEDGTKRIGHTFIWNGEQAELTEGTFDLKAWQEAEYGSAVS